jgi:hypothetical protein
MVTLIKYGALSGGEKYNVNVLSLDGLSTDTKPTVTYIEYGSDGREVGRMGIPNGSLYTEIDTGDTYMYDADNTTWHKVSIGGGGGGGGSTDSYTKAETNALLSGKADLDNDGLIPASQIPPEVFERMKIVQNDIERFALTIDDVQNGDVVYVDDDEIMYYVYDDTKLNRESGYKPFAAGVAAKAIADKNGNDISTSYVPLYGNYFVVNNIRVYVSATAPTGARTGDLWIGG